VCKSIRGRSTKTITRLTINQNLPLPQAILLFKKLLVNQFLFRNFQNSIIQRYQVNYSV
jgi:hypothetical protein